MDQIFHITEQVAEVLQREVFEDGNHLHGSLYPWSSQGRGELQLQGHSRWAKGWPCGTEACRSCKPQTTSVGPTSWAGASPFCCFCVVWAHRIDVVDATWGLCGSGWLCCVGRALNMMGSFLSCSRACSDLHCASYTAFTEQNVIEKCYIKSNTAMF